MMPKLYIIRETLEGEQEEPLYGDGRMIGMHLDRASARKALRAADADRRDTGDVTRLFSLYEPKQLLALTDFDPPVFADWLTDADIPPVPPKFYDKRNRWEPWLRKLTLAQRVHLLRGLHKLEFYEIIEVDFIEGAYPEGLEDAYEQGTAGESQPW